MMRAFTIRTMTAIAAAAVIGVTVAACGGSGNPAAATTVQGCTAAFEQQIVYSESHHLVNPDLPLPAACAGLTTAELKLAAADSVIAEMPS